MTYGGWSGGGQRRGSGSLRGWLRAVCCQYYGVFLIAWGRMAMYEGEVHLHVEIWGGLVSYFDEASSEGRDVPIIIHR